MGNDTAIGLIRSHHTELARQLAARTDAVLAAAEGDGDVGAAREQLCAWYRDELMPHVAAEEQALYRPGEAQEPTRLLVAGMLAEHRALAEHVARLARAEGPVGMATAAASAQAVFEVHLSKENDLLLPALDRAGLDIAAMVHGLHEILGGEGYAHS